MFYLFWGWVVVRFDGCSFLEVWDRHNQELRCPTLMWGSIDLGTMTAFSNWMSSIVHFGVSMGAWIFFIAKNVMQRFDWLGFIFVLQNPWTNQYYIRWTCCIFCFFLALTIWYNRFELDSTTSDKLYISTVIHNDKRILSSLGQSMIKLSVRRELPQ